VSVMGGDLGLLNAEAVELFGGSSGGMKRFRSESEILQWNLEARTWLNSAHLIQNIDMNPIMQKTLKNA
jgi:hypothetical protein